MSNVILYIAIGEYYKLWDDFYHSARKNKTLKDSQFLVFSDQTEFFEAYENVTTSQKAIQPWPGPTLNRFNYFLSEKEKVLAFDSAVFCNADIIFNENFDLQNFLDNDQLSFTQHPGWFDKHPRCFDLEFRKNSEFYQRWGSAKHYVWGGFYGGPSQLFVEMSQLVNDMLQQDLANDIVPIWHDETMINWYAENNSVLAQSPRYGCPIKWNLHPEPFISVRDKRDILDRKFQKTKNSDAVYLNTEKLLRDGFHFFYKKTHRSRFGKKRLIEE